MTVLVTPLHTLLTLVGRERVDEESSLFECASTKSGLIRLLSTPLSSTAAAAGIISASVEIICVGAEPFLYKSGNTRKSLFS